MFLLKDKLERVRKSRRNSTILVFVMVIVSGLFWNEYYEFDFLTGLILATVLGTVAVWLIRVYYGKQEIAVIRQIENLSN